jgi:hypothetical protein
VPPVQPLVSHRAFVQCCQCVPWLFWPSSTSSTLKNKTCLWETSRSRVCSCSDFAPQSSPHRHCCHGPLQRLGPRRATAPQSPPPPALWSAVTRAAAMHVRVVGAWVQVEARAPRPPSLGSLPSGRAPPSKEFAVRHGRARTASSPVPLAPGPAGCALVRVASPSPRCAVAWGCRAMGALAGQRSGALARGTRTLGPRWMTSRCRLACGAACHPRTTWVRGWQWRVWAPPPSRSVPFARAR